MVFWHPEKYDKKRKTTKSQELSEMEQFIDWVEEYEAMVDDD